MNTCPKCKLPLYSSCMRKTPKGFPIFFFTCPKHGIVYRKVWKGERTKVEKTNAASTTYVEDFFNACEEVLEGNVRYQWEWAYSRLDCMAWYLRNESGLPGDITCSNGTCNVCDSLRLLNAGYRPPAEFLAHLVQYLNEAFGSN